MNVLVGTYRQANYEWIKARKLYNLPLLDWVDEDLYRSFTGIVLFNGEKTVVSGAISFCEIVDLTYLKKLGYNSLSSYNRKKYVLYRLLEEKPYEAVLSQKNVGVYVGSKFFLTKIDANFFVNHEPEIFYGGFLNICSKLKPFFQNRSKEIYSYNQESSLFEFSDSEVEKDEINQDISRQFSNFKQIKIATLFSGIGAFEQAVDKMGLPHKIIFACDNGERELKISNDDLLNRVNSLPENERENFIRSIYSNYGGENMMERSYKANYQINDSDFYQDIRFLNGKKYFNEVDMIVGGSPCQSFSCNGKRGGLKDTRGTLFYEYARIINEVCPKCFIFENVKGLITHDHGKTWEIVKNVFRELDYDIYINKDKFGCESPVLNAADYGIPQRRLRLYLVGISKKIKMEKNFCFPKPVPLRHFVPEFLQDNVDKKYYLGQKGFEFVTTHPSRASVGQKIMNCQKANQQFNWNGDFIFEPLSSKHTPEILSKAYLGNWNNQSGVIRMFTPRECLRLMGFPDKFKIVVNDTMMWRQSGNSIVVNVLQSLVSELLKTGIFDKC